jgi:hypothetical protein
VYWKNSKCFCLEVRRHFAKIFQIQPACDARRQDPGWRNHDLFRIPAFYQCGAEICVPLRHVLGRGGDALHPALALYNIWPEKLQRIASVAINIFCILTVVAIFFFGNGLVRMVIETGQTSEAAFIPMWLIYGAFPVGSILMMLGYAETALRHRVRKPIKPSDISFDQGRHDS